MHAAIRAIATSYCVVLLEHVSASAATFEAASEEAVNLGKSHQHAMEARQVHSVHCTSSNPVQVQ